MLKQLAAVLRTVATRLADVAWTFASHLLRSRRAGDLHLADGKIHISLNPLSAPRRTRALTAICDLLNDTETVYPDTDLVLHYTVKPHLGAA